MIILYQTLRDLWRLLDSRNRWISGLLVILLVFGAALEIGSIFFLFGYLGALSNIGNHVSWIGAIYRRIGEGFEGPAYAAVTGLVLVAFFAIKNANGLITSFALMRFAMKRYQKIAARLFSGFLETRLEIVQQRGLLGPQQILTSVATVFRNGFIPALEALSDLAVLATMLLALMFVVDPVLVLTAGLFLGAGGLVLLASTRRLSAWLGALRISAERMVSQTMLEGFRGLIDIRLSGHIAEMVSRYTRSTADFAMADRRARALDMAPRALNEMLLAGGIVVAAVYFASSPGGLQGALPSLAVLGFAGLRISAAMSRLTENIQRLREIQPSRLRLLNAIYETAPDLLSHLPPGESQNYLADEKPLPEGSLGRLTKSVTVENVSFTYPGADSPALCDVSLEIPQGSFIGLCGPSGSGKSTLALVIIGLLQPHSGRVLCDGWNIFDHVATWHKNIAFVGQAPFIAPRNVRENVAFGYNPNEIDDARVWEALKIAALDGVIRGRKEGLDSMMGEEGVLLSGGQRQRLSIARALYRNPEILVFDEATAALDNITEAEISAAISAMSRKKTVIAIAHRLTTIRDCDEIHYMEDGRILASGNFNELSSHCPPFQKMARRESASASSKTV